MIYQAMPLCHSAKCAASDGLIPVGVAYLARSIANTSTWMVRRSKSVEKSSAIGADLHKGGLNSRLEQR